MFKLNKTIDIGGIQYTHMLFVRGEFDLRIPAVDLYPALVRDTGDTVLLGVWRLTDQGTIPEYTELLTAMRFAPEAVDGVVPPEQEALVAAIRQQFLVFLEGLEQIAVGMQADPDKNRLTHLKIALSKFPLAATFEPLGTRTIGVEVVDERTPQPKEKSAA
jgi:hypothetical protein